MDTLCNDLGIPKNQIKNTKTTNRFIVLASKSWLKFLVKHKKVIDFPIYESDQWPDYEKPWMIVNFCVSFNLALCGSMIQTRHNLFR